MAVPRNRTSNARKNSRRAHHAKKPKNVSKCSNCGNMRISHHVCPGCGHYANRLVVASD
ncbi:MAG TPA: 50S ribosomal protein L32 [Rhabdochlamydiaceae bacterium]|nr:50S ribosomal protein L32 [Rhabdochlamydiaceae bacterium]